MVTMNDRKHNEYGVTYDSYWSQGDRIGESSGSLPKVAEIVAMHCGLGKTLDVGAGEGILVGELLKKGIDAYGVDVSKIVVARSNARLTGRFRQGSALCLPYGDEAFHTVVSTDCLGNLFPEDVPAALREIYRVSSRFFFLQVATTPDRDNHWHLTVEGRAWWESRCFEAGFRKHSSYYHINPYETLNNDSSRIYVLLEKIPPTVWAQYALSVLDQERLLHMDMLRETGRRGDAHCIRYHMAAQYIRPGDVVLDVACGLGYGSHILFQNSQAISVTGVDLSEVGIAYARANYGMDDVVRFLVGDAQSLAFMPDNSIDFITGFETIEHLPNPDAYMSELKRLLRPSGRLMICAPNDWTDENGKDPNPYHLQVYTWERLITECKSFFLLEKGFVQTAGGAIKYHHSPRRWKEITIRPTLNDDAEWIILLCMKDPVNGSGIYYKETTWRIPDSLDFNVSAFARDYKNPWLVKGMVAIGMRNQSSDCLRSMQQRVMEISCVDSVDFGAALCGLAYGNLVKIHFPNGEYEFLMDHIGKYVEIKNPSPHQLRWQVSLLFAGAELAKKYGRLAEAESFYSACAEKDVLLYSPLLGTKTLDALFWLAIIALGRHDYAAAKLHLLRSVRETRRLISGSWVNICGEMNDPLPFGLAEAAQLVDKGGRAAYMLAVLDDYERRPTVFSVESKGFYERLLFCKDSDQFANRQSIDDLAREVARQDARAQVLAEEVAEKDRFAQALAREVAERDGHAQDLAREVARQDAHAQVLAEKVAEKDRFAQALAREVAERDGHAQDLAREVARQDAHAQVLAEKVAEKDRFAQALAREVAERDGHAQDLAREVARQDAHAQALAEAIGRLNEQVQFAHAEKARLQAQISQIEHELQLEKSKTLWQRLKKRFMENEK